ncbi:Spheroidene monooxygenase [Fibrisoma limi BUZ 3]|uniref:Spheroidene monooxygenase n=1 Tax=Fibrisoma limi BUZ 3 TaxID=1185876 RepID=I2GQH0_9BACT|nr:hypothetical protein [Fibrisoma limi]CCH56148.1 Spheroidene monooxygenase [Fibrisoma limi BUZ 3]
MPLVTVTILRYAPLARFRAFANMGRFLMKPVQADGLRFQKLLGSGHNFGLIPDFSTYVFLGVWEDSAAVDSFLQSKPYSDLQRGTTQVSTLYLQPQRSHGLWDGQNPFLTAKAEAMSDPSAPVAVLTRATIRPRALPDFWQHVPQARQRLNDHRNDLVFGIGVGEVPIVQQCTISVWRNAAAVDQYAYRQSGHKEVVRLTRQRHWYSEELFARFSVLRIDGQLPA